MNDLPGKMSSTRVFLSYARNDDEGFVRRLHADLAKEGFAVWFDRESLLSRGLSFHQEIKDAIRTEVDRVVYVGGPKAATSPYVREEWQFALECDHVVVTPILRLGDYGNVPGELSLLHCEDFRDDANYPAALAKLIASLRQSNPKLGALFAVPDLPPHFLGRPELMRRVRDALLVDLQKPQVITSADARVGMQGMGGIGKSVLAAALARNREVRQSYPDGIVWISCGQNLTRDDLIQRQRDLAKHLGGDKPFDSLPQGQGVLRELLGTKAVLLVLDDVWQATDAQPFDVLGPRCRMLVTTRDAGILHALHGEHIPVSLFTEPEALQLLAEAVGVERAALPLEAQEVVAECGCLPLAVALSGGMAKKRSGDFSSVLERLRRADLEKIADRQSINEQHRTIWRAMQASVEVLAEEEQHRFAELAAFDTDRTIPEAAVATLWAHTGNLHDLDTEDLLINLAERSLIQLDVAAGAEGGPQRRFRLHDLLHDYAVRIAGESTELHRKLIDAYRRKCPGGWHTGPNDGYFFETLVQHHAHMQAGPETEALVTDFSWLMRKSELGLLDSIIQDYDYGLMNGLEPAAVKNRLEIWQAFFREKMHILGRGNAEWPSHKILLQLAVEHADDSPLTIGAEQWLAEGRCDWAWLRRNRRLPHAQINPCLAVLEGHSDFVRGALVLPDGKILSWASDHTLRIWDAHSGKCLTVLKGHSIRFPCALVLPDGRILSWSCDPTPRIWDAHSGECLAALEGHSGGVVGALVLPDGRILSWASDHTLRIWDALSGECLSVLQGHSNDVRGALRLPDGKILSWANAPSLRIWDAEKGKCLTVLEGHGSVEGALILPGGRILSWSSAHTLRIWDVKDGTCLAVLQGHSGSVEGALTLPDGRILSWSSDHTLRIWDAKDGACLAVLQGHSGGVRGALALPDGRILSWSNGLSLRIWDTKSGKCLTMLKGHGSVEGALMLPDGRILSWAVDNTLRIWDATSGLCLTVLEGHSLWPRGALALPEGRILSWALDHTLRLWNSPSGVHPTVVEKHIFPRGALTLPDGRILTWAFDHTLRLWDAKNGACLAALEGHSGGVVGALTLSDGRILSWAEDHTLRIWDDKSRECLAVLEGHAGTVQGALKRPDGRILSWSSDHTLRVWDAKDGACLAVFEGHSRSVEGALTLSNGKILSWSGDHTLRIWGAKDGTCLTILHGHSEEVEGALALPDGKLLSWSEDHTLRIWDAKDGRCLVVLQGHSNIVRGALALPEGRILSWSKDHTLRVWDGLSGLCLETFQNVQDPAWLHTRAKAENPSCVSLNFFAVSTARTAYLYHRAIPSAVAAWNAGSDSYARCLLPDGTVVVLQQNGQVCILKLHHGNRAISLAELERMVRGKPPPTS